MLAVSADKEAFWSAFNAIPWQLVWIPNNSLLLSLATAGISGIAGVGQPPLSVRLLSVAWLAILAASLIVWTGRRHGFTAKAILPAAALLVSWCAVIGILVNLDTFGIPSLGFIHNSSVVITLFLPLALLGGALVGFAVGCLSHPRYSPLVAILVGLTVAIWGAGQMRDIINPKTVLVQPADLEAMEWVLHNTDEDAAIAINVSQWQGRTYAGSDAGYWLGVLTGRRSILPPALYATALPSDQAGSLNALMQEWHAVDSVDSPEAQQLLRDEGIAYIFVGGAGGHLDTSKLEHSPYVEMVYTLNDTPRVQAEGLNASDVD